MNFSNEKLIELATNLHLQIEVAKLNGETPQEAAVSNHDISKDLGELRTLLSGASEVEKEQMKKIILAQTDEMAKAVNHVYIIVTMDVCSACSNLGMDMEYAKAFVQASRDAMIKVKGLIEELFEEPEQEAPKRKPVLLS